MATGRAGPAGQVYRGVDDAPAGLLAAADRALAGARDVPLWLDTPDRPAPRPELREPARVDLAVVGGGFTGLWAALQAVEENPGRSVLLIEGGTLGWAASGRNGGFCSASLTHGEANGAERWPEELATLERLGQENLDGIEETIARLGIDCGFRREGELSVAVEPWQVEDLARFGDLLDAPATRAFADSPLYLAGLHDPRGTAVLDPARLVWGLAAAAERLGVRIVEGTRVRRLQRVDDGVLLHTRTADGHPAEVFADRVVLGTNAFPSPLRRVRPFVVPVWDHVLATEPLTRQQQDALGWDSNVGLSDAGNQFHYYRRTLDGRIVWGGYDALYYYGSDVRDARQRRPATERALAVHLLQTFPQLEGVRISHRWAGAIDTCTRFTAFWTTALGGRVASVQGYTGLGVGASRFGARVALDLLDGRRTERTELRMVRSAPVPFPPEPLRWTGIELTRRSIAAADARAGRRNPWLRTLDRLGLGFDS